ncbi:hypothetical protein [Cryobacterium sp. Y57]|uniref:hypothetical protein n=1 Tax=Cryobacterium sp. Y57 TaxID=2048287 RepID=UPI000CE3B59B|nr:hypothetical protein [Cryobacterium sp. Y57]
MSKITFMLAATAVLLLAGCSSAGTVPDAAPFTVAPTIAPEPTIEPTVEPERLALTYPNGEFPGNGTFVINVDIEPGTYGSDDGTAGANCHWQLQDEAGEALRDGTDANGVLILEGQHRFVSEACPVWVKLD